MEVIHVDLRVASNKETRFNYLWTSRLDAVKSTLDKDDGDKELEVPSLSRCKLENTYTEATILGVSSTTKSRVDSLEQRVKSITMGQDNHSHSYGHLRYDVDSLKLTTSDMALEINDLQLEEEGIKALAKSNHESSKRIHGLFNKLKGDVAKLCTEITEE